MTGNERKAIMRTLAGSQTLAGTAVAAILLVAVSVGVVYAGLGTSAVGKIDGEFVITGEDGARQAVVTAQTMYAHGTRTGTAMVDVKQGGARLAAASAALTADAQEQAAGGTTALVLLVTGRTPAGDGRTGLQLSDIMFEGDSRAFAAMADQIIDWWDSLAKLTFDSYRSPRPSLATLGKLQLNVWGTKSDETRLNSFAILFFDPADPTNIVSGTVRRPGFLGNVAAGGLLEETLTPAPGDFNLHFFAEDVSNPGVFVASFAELAVDVLPDGTLDVRGVALNHWAGVDGEYIVEGTGDAFFVVPTQ
jgi:hypothetical protein